MSSRSWKQHLNELPSNGDGYKNLNSFYEALNIDLPTKDSIKNITEDKYDPVACVDGGNIVQLIHSISNLGEQGHSQKIKSLALLKWNKKAFVLN